MCFEIFFHSKMNFNIILVLLILFSNSICEDKQDTESDEIFVPTKEWKVIKAGQKVPSGLHYRINLSTGKKEAKINEDDESDTNKKGISVIKEDETLYSALKDVDKKNPENDMPKKFRTLDEIKKDLGDIEITPKSDVEILQDLFAKFQEEDKKKQPNTKEILKILKDLIYLSHQIDNGNEFVRMDGFKKIVYKKLNSTNLAVKQEALKLFSTLAQNSPKVKVHILETGGITILLRLLNLDDNPHIKNSAVTALSCTLRTFPYAQNRFIEAGGLTIFSSLFKSGSVKLKLKLVTLLNDFIIERQKDVSNFENHELVDIEEKLYELGWCNSLNNLLTDLIQIDIYDYDSIEKCLLSMKGMVKKCSNSYNKALFNQLESSYSHLKDEDTEDYFQYIINDLIGVLLYENNNNKTKVAKEEL